MKALALPLLALLLPSCALRDSTDEPDEGDDDLVLFEFNSAVDRLAVGTELEVGYTATAAFRLASSDPSVLEAQEEEGGLIRLVARSPGIASLRAESADGSRELAALPIEVAPAEAIELYFRTGPVASEPIDRLVALRDTTESIRVVYRDGNGEVLAGRGAFSATGDGVAIADAELVEGRISEVFEPGFAVPLSFGAAGQGEVTAELPGLSASIPIELVAAPAEIELVAMVLRDDVLVAADQVVVSEPIGVDVVGRTAEGRFVGGVTGSWTTSLPVDVWFDPGPSSSEIVFSIESATRVGVTATVETADGTLAATRELTAEEPPPAR